MITNCGPYGAGIIAENTIPKGQLIFKIRDFSIIDHATYQTIQIGPHEHLLDNGIIVYLNHSCNPNAFVNTADLTVCALKDIASGEELTFFYPSTEWEMASPFNCMCRSPNCLKYVAGAKCMPAEILLQYQINSHILNMAGLDIDKVRKEADPDAKISFSYKSSYNKSGSERVVVQPY